MGSPSLHTRTKCITLDGFSYTSLISLFVANSMRFFVSRRRGAQVWLVALTHVWVAHFLTLLSMVGDLLVGYHLTRRHRS